MKLIFLFLFSTHLFATETIQLVDESCSSIDLRSAFKYKPRNQDKMSWCYAFTTADMIGYEYGLDKLSAADIALNYNRHWLPSTMNAFKKFYMSLFNKGDWVVRNREHVTGFIKIAVKRALKNGLCLQKYSPDNYLIKVDKKKYFSKKITYRTAMDEIHGVAKAFKDGRLSLKDLDFYYKTPETEEEDFVDLVSNYPINRILIELNNRSCKERIFLESRKYDYHFKGKKFFTRMNKQLDKKKPVAIDYHGKVRSQPSNFKKAIKGLHTSYIVGRRFNKKSNSCEYLVRDSYGSKSCKKYHSSFDCERGHFWIKDELLYKALVSYSYFN